MTKSFLSEIIKPNGYTTKSFSLKFIYKSANQLGDRAITQSWTVHYSPTENDYKQSAILNHSTEDTIPLTSRKHDFVGSLLGQN